MKRFWDKVDKSDDCWEWLAYKDKDGYGRFRVDGQWVGAHRFVFEMKCGRIPAGMCVCHSCDNPSCVNPEHLWLGTHEDNLRDMAEKGRARCPGHKGESNGRAKLTEEDVRGIRQLKEPVPLIAKCFGVSEGQIYRIRSGQHWAHI